MPGDRSWESVKECWPTASRAELMLRFIKWRIATRTVIDAGIWHMLIVFTGVHGLGTLLTKDPELF